MNVIVCHAVITAVRNESQAPRRRRRFRRWLWSEKHQFSPHLFLLFLSVASPVSLDQKTWSPQLFPSPALWTPSHVPLAPAPSLHAFPSSLPRFFPPFLLSHSCPLLTHLRPPLPKSPPIHSCLKTCGGDQVLSTEIASASRVTRCASPETPSGRKWDYREGPTWVERLPQRGGTSLGEWIANEEAP